MEEAILKIMKHNHQISHRSDKLIIKGESKSTKEIADTFLRFMDWIRKDCIPSIINETWDIFNERNEVIKQLSSNELFTYWNTNFNK